MKRTLPVAPCAQTCAQTSAQTCAQISAPTSAQTSALTSADGACTHPIADSSLVPDQGPAPNPCPKLNLSSGPVPSPGPKLNLSSGSVPSPGPKLNLSSGAVPSLDKSRALALRLAAQQLWHPLFREPAELVSWMGAVQAQDVAGAKWALALRLQPEGMAQMEEALREGRILRTHVMRPTWHWVAAADIRWMVALTGRRIQQANAWLARDRGLEISETHFRACNDRIAGMLAGGYALTKQEIGERLAEKGVPADAPYLTRYLMRAETDGLLCSGPEKEGKQTYALLDERVPPYPALTDEEALALLARRYFQSHSPASLADFAWWSGLSVAEARRAVGAIESELSPCMADGNRGWVHHAASERLARIEERVGPAEEALENVAHLLPPYDEYLVSYKNRTLVLDQAHARKAYNSYGIFYPVVLQGGRIRGNWTRMPKGGAASESLSASPKKRKAEAAREAKMRACLSFFEAACLETTAPPHDSPLSEAVRRYLRFTSLTGSVSAD